MKIIESVGARSALRLIAMAGTASLAMGGLACSGEEGAAPGASGSAQALTSDPDAFIENFDWIGNHASSVGHDHHQGSTVWWNEDNWDSRGETGWLATAYAYPGQTGYHLDVHRAITSDPRVGIEDNETKIIGGDGSPGIGVMRLDYQGISSSRLRNPVLISSDRPAVVDFYAPLYVTTGHWWEISLTPTDTVIGAEVTSVPNQVAKDPFEDSLNFVTIGASDLPCSYGERVSLEVHRTVKGATDPVYMLPRSKEPIADMNEDMTLTHFRLEFSRDRVRLLADLKDTGTLEHLHDYPVGVPWSEAHVQLLGVAYQADHHPGDACNGNPLNRELVWRNVTVSPVKYERTSIAPRNTVTENVQRKLGFMSYDTRDIQRFGPPEADASPANEGPYDRYWTAAFEGVSGRKLVVELDEEQARAERAMLVYDIRGRGKAELSVNGTFVGRLPGEDSLRYFQGPYAESGEWARRSLDIPRGALKAGKNELSFSLSPAIGMERLVLEFMHD